MRLASTITVLQMLAWKSFERSRQPDTVATRVWERWGNHCEIAGAVTATYLYVTVHDAAVVNVLHSAGKLPHESARVLLRQLAVRHDVVLCTQCVCRYGKGTQVANREVSEPGRHRFQT